jgi:hypothetical protein
MGANLYWPHSRHLVWEIFGEMFKKYQRRCHEQRGNARCTAKGIMAMVKNPEQPSTANHKESAKRHADLSLIQALRSELEHSAASQANAVDEVRSLAAQEIHTLKETIQSLRDKLEDAVAASSSRVERTRAETAACRREMRNALSALRDTLQTERIAAANRLEAERTAFDLERTSLQKTIVTMRDKLPGKLD